MSTATQTCDIAIPGYVLTDRIGSGGYAEVWRAEAPGGIQKAVKIVYGHYDDEFASQELKALERIKGVRHPFLLSLERFETVNGRLGDSDRVGRHEPRSAAQTVPRRGLARDSSRRVVALHGRRGRSPRLPFATTQLVAPRYQAREPADSRRSHQGGRLRAGEGTCVSNAKLARLGDDADLCVARDVRR